MAKTNHSAAVEAIKDTIYRSCLLMDDEHWTGWLKLCDQDFYYKITAFSPEIRKDVLYLDGDRAQIEQVCNNLSTIACARPIIWRARQRSKELKDKEVDDMIADAELQANTFLVASGDGGGPKDVGTIMRRFERTCEEGERLSSQPHRIVERRIGFWKAHGGRVIEMACRSKDQRRANRVRANGV